MALERQSAAEVELAEKKRKHNAIEQVRREKLRSKFVELRQMTGIQQNDRGSILRAAISTLRVRRESALTGGQLIVTSGQLTVTSGQLTVTRGQLTVTSGQLTVTSGQLLITSDQRNSQ